MTSIPRDMRSYATKLLEDGIDVSTPARLATDTSLHALRAQLPATLDDSRLAVQVPDTSGLWGWLTGTVSASGNTTLIAAPGAGYQLVLQKLLVQNATSTATTVILKAGATSQITIRTPADGDGLLDTFDPTWLVAEDTALVINLSGANTHVWTVRYRVAEVSL
jgi:hypothetical protein